MAGITNAALAPNDQGLEISLGNQPKNEIKDTKSVPHFQSLSNVDQAIKYSHIFSQLDIIASSRHIKTLFKIPFSKDPISLAVHRIGKTLIFDDFFLNLHSNSSSSKHPKPRVVPQEGRGEEDRINLTRHLSLPELNTEDLDGVQGEVTRNIIPFTRQPLIPLDQPLPPGQRLNKRERKPIERRYSEGAGNLSHQTRLSYSKLSNPSLFLSSAPQPLTLTTSRDITLSYGPCLRDILWRFEDYSMLLGCDLPIFGMGTYPAVSLFLQDARMPINVLTGIDIWLDNLMNNVPEVLMAYHVENVIRNYEVVNNDSIPTLANSKFSPDLISDICSNILHFLKANCTKEGHTYWLLREKGEDIIKLYDLTSLVQYKKEPNIPQQFYNPFVDPVALLFYKVAAQMYRNLVPDVDTYPEELGTVKHMLEQVIRLLASVGRPSNLSLTAYQLLTDIFLSLNSITQILFPEAETEATKKVNKHRKKKSKKVPWNQSSSASAHQERNYLVPVASGVNRHVSWSVDNVLTSRGQYAAVHKSLPTPIKLGSNEERARVALDYIVSSLDLAANLQNDGDFVSKYVNEMLTKAAGCFYMIGLSNFTQARLGRTLRYAIYGLRTIIPICNAQSSDLVLLLKFYILELTGDTLCQLAKSNEISSQEEDFIETDADLYPILSHTPDRVVFDSFTPPAKISSDRVETLLNSIDCYLYLESLTDKSTRFRLKTDSLMKRLGNAYNEIGLMSVDSIMAQDQLTAETKLELAKSAFVFFKNAIFYFKRLEDVLNLALVHSNCGRLLRICAFHLTSKMTKEKDQWRHYCEEAIDAYKNGIKLLSTGQYPDLSYNLKFDLTNVKIQIVTFLINSKMDGAEIHDISEHLKGSISILEELVPIQFGRQTEAIFNLSLAYYYFGKIERRHFEECSRNKNEKSKNHYHLSDKYFMKSNEILDCVTQIKHNFLIQKCKNYIQLHDLIMLNSHNFKLLTKLKSISSAISHLSNLLSVCTCVFPAPPPGDVMMELSEFGAQSLDKLRFINSLLIKQAKTYPSIAKEVADLGEILGQLKFSVIEYEIKFDSSLLERLFSSCEKIILNVS